MAGKYVGCYDKAKFADFETEAATNALGGLIVGGTLMVALPLFDVLMASDESSERSRIVAEQLVAAALDDLDRIQALDSKLMPAGAGVFDRQTAALVLGIYEDWAQRAEGLELRLRRLAERSIAVEKYAALRDAHGRICAMLSVSLEHVVDAERDLDEGNTVAIEEVRRELGHRIQQTSH